MYNILQLLTFVSHLSQTQIIQLSTLRFQYTNWQQISYRRSVTSVCDL